MAALVTQAQGRRLITGGDPDKHFAVPADGDFVPEDWLEAAQGRTRDDEDAPHRDFIPAPEIARIAALLIREHATFKHLRNVAIEYRWKRRGGSSGGKATLGKCVKVSGLTKEFTEARLVIWLGADTCRDLRATHYQVEALVFHELMHAETDEDDKPVVNPHDFEGFAREIELYGLWRHDAVVMGRAFAAVQLPLFKAVNR